MHKIEFDLLNVKTTFLYREIDDDIYMQQPEGFIVKGKEDYMCLLKKLLYSLKQSLDCSIRGLTHFMTAHDFKKNHFMTIMSTLKTVIMGHLYNYSYMLMIC